MLDLRRCRSMSVEQFTASPLLTSKSFSCFEKELKFFFSDSFCLCVTSCTLYCVKRSSNSLYRVIALNNYLNNISRLHLRREHCVKSCISSTSFSYLASDWLTHWLIVWLIVWLVDWLIDCGLTELSAPWSYFVRYLHVYVLAKRLSSH